MCTREELGLVSGNNDSLSKFYPMEADKRGDLNLIADMMLCLDESEAVEIRGDYSS